MGRASTAPGPSVSAVTVRIRGCSAPATTSAFTAAADIGVQGSGTNIGVFASASGESATGVVGTGSIGVSGTGSAAGLFGKSTSAWGLWCDGHAYFTRTILVLGDFSAYGSKAFLIDHPLDPANRMLAHACVEAPEVLNLYSGTVTLDPKGTATIRLPRYFGTLNREFCYQLTAIGAQAPGLHVSREVESNRFAIAGGVPGQKVCWQVTGIRQDAWMKAHPFRAERPKPRRDRGKYLNPKLFGEPVSAAIHAPLEVDRRARRGMRPGG